MNRAEMICKGVTVAHDEAVALAEAVVMMSEKITETLAAIKDEPLAVYYDNGGGQTGTRENPKYTAFEKLMATYIKSLRQLIEMVEKGTQTKETMETLKGLNELTRKKVG